MTGEWEPTDRTDLLAKRRRALLLTGLLQFLIPLGILVTRAIDGRSLLTFGLVIVLVYSAFFMVVTRPLWAPRARARWTAKVLDDAIIEHALATREQVPPELHARVSSRAQQVVSEVTLTVTVMPILIVIAASAGLSEWAHSLVWWIAGGLVAVVVIAVGVIRTNRRAQPARRWLAGPPPPLVPDGARDRG